MQPKSGSSQRELFGSQLREILNLAHPLCVLAGKIAWSQFEAVIDSCYAEDLGRPGVNTRLMVGLLYLKSAFNESDESVVERWVENPYWQFFCGCEYMQHQPPIDPSSLSRWRSRVGAQKLESLLHATLDTAKALGALPPADLAKINVDTTVQEKAIAFPTDARLYHKLRKALVRYAEQHGIALRQNYCRVGEQLRIQQSRYAAARQYKQAAKCTRKLKTILGRVVRDIERKAPRNQGEIVCERLRTLLAMAQQLLAQTRHSKQKLYSVHAPEVECIAKGKVHKKYEFGCKVSLATTSKSNWIVAAQALSGNPYDGHTLASTLTQVTRLTGCQPTDVITDQGYRKHNYRGAAKVHVVQKIPREATRGVRKMLKRRSSIEPTIGHLKSDHRLQRNHLQGTAGDQINALLAAAAYNLRKLLRWVVGVSWERLWCCLVWLKCQLFAAQCAIPAT